MPRCLRSRFELLTPIVAWRRFSLERCRLEPNPLGGTFGLPTVCCFIPSLASGSLFKVSIHSWNTPMASDFARSYSDSPKDVKFEARLFIDGRIAAYDYFMTHAARRLTA